MGMSTVRVPVLMPVLMQGLGSSYCWQWGLCPPSVPVLSLPGYSCSPSCGDASRCNRDWSGFLGVLWERSSQVIPPSLSRILERAGPAL